MKKVKKEVVIPTYTLDKEYIRVMRKFKRTEPTLVDLSIKKIVESINVSKKRNVIVKNRIILSKSKKEKGLLI